jgi:hypothetical protein
MRKDIETFRGRIPTSEHKKTDMAEHPKVFGHVGLLFK